MPCIIVNMATLSWEWRPMGTQFEKYLHKQNYHFCKVFIILFNLWLCCRWDSIYQGQNFQGWRPCMQRFPTSLANSCTFQKNVCSTTIYVTVLQNVVFLHVFRKFYINYVREDFSSLEASHGVAQTGEEEWQHYEQVLVFSYVLTHFLCHNSN